MHENSAESMTGKVFLFRMMLVLKNHQNTSNHGYVKNAHRKPTVRMFQATAVTKTTEWCPDDHFFYWAKMSHQCPTYGVHGMAVV